MYGKLIALTASIAITTTGLALLATPAFGKTAVVAETLGDPAVAHISYADLDLTSTDGQNALRVRVDTAVRSICGGLADKSSGVFAEINCRSASWQGVHPQIARAVQRARELAATGTTAIPPVSIALPK